MTELKSGGKSTGQMVEVATELAALFGQRAEAHELAGTFPYENYDDLRRSSYHLASIPARYGGWGASIGQLTRAQARLGEGCASTALVVSMHLAQIGRALLAGWPLNRLEEVLAGVVAQGYLLNSAQSEPGTGSPSRGGIPATTASPNPAGYVINGRKTWTTGSPVLHYIIISAAITQAEAGNGDGDNQKDKEKVKEDNGLPTRPPAVGNFLVSRDMPGLTIDPTWNSLGMRLTASHDLLLNNVQVGPPALLLTNPRTSPEASALNAAWGLTVAAVYFGIGRAAARYAARYARDRRPNSLDRSIAELAHIQDKAGRMELALLSAENTLYAVADLADAGEAARNPARLTALAGAAKQLATNKAIEAVDLAMRIVGGASLSMDAPMQRFYRDVRAGLHNPPMDDVSTAMLGKLALELL